MASFGSSDFCNHTMLGADHKIAIGCDPNDTPRVQSALANGMFGEDGTWPDCDATCLYDVDSPSTVAYAWDANRSCWRVQRLAYHLSELACPLTQPAGAYIDSHRESASALRQLRFSSAAYGLFLVIS